MSEGRAEWPRVAVIGCGYWGKNLIRNYAELGVLAAIVDHYGEKSAPLAERYQVRVAGYEEVLADPRLQAIVIATPGPSHFALASQALAVGKHVYVEKPLAMARADVLSLTHQAKERNLTLMGGHILRYHAAFVTVLNMVQAGEIGRPRHVVSERLNLGKILDNEDVIWSLAPHDVSMVLALMGQLPKSISCVGNAFFRPDITDIATLRLDYAGHSSAEIRLSWMAPVKQHRLTVYGEKGVLIFDDTKPWAEKVVLFRPELDWTNPAIQPVNRPPTSIPVSESEPLKAECRHFLDSVANQTAPLTDGAESAAVIGLIERAQASLRAAGAPS